MPALSIYKTSLGLLTDLYQLTMAYAYWRSGRHEWQAAFHLFFRTPPFGGGYAVFGGLAYAVDFLRDFRFRDDDLSYLAGLRADNGQPMFSAAFLDYLSQMRFACDVHAPPEGETVFPHEPLMRVTGPILQCQLLETALLNIVNFQTLIATKAARIATAAHGDPVLEFGLRRAQGCDGSLAASYAAHLGGATATSNVLAGKLFGIPVKGTHAHSWVMSFDDEPAAFEAYARAMPHNCVFLVDTYDTLEGVRRAIDVGRKLRTRGFRMLGIRLDSGDLAELSRQARALLDKAGFERAQIVASNDLDECAIADLKEAGARIDVWGVGTRLATAYDQPALGGVYKLGALREPGGPWRYKLKLSEESLKTSNPGVLQTRRYSIEGRFFSDVLYDEMVGAPHSPAACHIQKGASIAIPSEAVGEDLLQPVFHAGKLIREPASLSDARAFAAGRLARLAPETRKLKDAAGYPVGLEPRLAQLKQQLTRNAGDSSHP